MTDKEEDSFWIKLSTKTAQHQLETSDMVLEEYTKRGVRAERFGFIELTQSKDGRTEGIGHACATNPDIRRITLKAKARKPGGPMEQDHFCVVIIEGEDWYFLNGIVMLHKDRPFEPEGWALVDSVAQVAKEEQNDDRSS